MPIFCVFCWAILFVLCLWFPPGSSITQVLKKCYNNGLLAAFRKFQHLKLKLGKAKLDLSVLQSSKRKLVIPRFLQFTVANCHLQNFYACSQCQWKLLEEEIHLKQSCVQILSSQSKAAYSELTSLVFSLDMIHLKKIPDQDHYCTLNMHQHECIHMSCPV